MSLDDKDALLEDMATHQRLTGQEVTAEANDRLAVPLFERIAHKLKDAKPSKPPPPPPKTGHVAARANEAKRADDMGRKPFRLLEDEELGPDRPVLLDQLQAEAYRLLMQRVDLLLTKKEPGPMGRTLQPSWHDRVVACSGEADPNARRIALLKIVEESNAAFGDWWREKARPLWFS